MFKFIQQYTEKISGVEIYPMLSLLIFFLFFVALLWYVKKMDKNKIKLLSDIPLRDDNASGL